jgi:hypothetical protein
MSKPTEFNWRPNVPERLLKGELFDRWEEVIIFLLHLKIISFTFGNTKK